jgi:hypothetical protein
MRIKFSPLYLLAAPLLCLFAFMVFQLPPIHDRLAWRIENLQGQVRYALKPPEKAVFVPNEEVAPLVRATLQALTLTPSGVPTMSSPALTTTPTAPGLTSTPASLPTLTATLPPIPAKTVLKGIVHEYQKWNNCGPSTLAMALSFWDWQGDQRDTAQVMKPNPRDKNVMPYEMQSYVEGNTGLKAVVRVGGDLDLLKHLIAAKFPVVVEKGFEVPGEGWMGHYEVLNGYDDARSVFIAQDSYIGPDLKVPYAQLEEFWRHFNDIYLVIYPPERENEVTAILGPQWDETNNYQYAAKKASDDIYALEGRDQYFAWFNRGTNLVKLQDFAGAAEAYDRAFAIYPSITEKERPWRMLWYQTGPYFAYFYTGRYYDVINLATATIDAVDEPAIEESFYWRAMARAALGDTAGAIQDYRQSLSWHPNFEPSVYQLTQLGAEP